jgi:chromate transporter
VTDAPTPLALFRLFGRLGFTAFGGPAVHLALIEAEVVAKRGWMTREALLDRVGMTNLIPGPNSTEVALHVGLALAGVRGFWAAGLGFVLPATFLVSALAAAYVAWGAVPAAAGALAAAQPVIAAIVAAVAWRLAPAAWGRPLPGALGLATAGLALAGAPELGLLVAAGGIAIAARRGGVAALVVAGAAGPAGAVDAPMAPASLLGAFLKIGAMLYGSGYVLVALLRSAFVAGGGPLTEGQLLDAVAIGQLTPGPLSTTATFVGWILGGPTGALAATVGIFAPAFLLVALSGPLVPRLRASATAAAFLDGVNAASLGLLAAAAIHLARAGAAAPLPAAVALVAFGALVRLRADPTVLLLGAGAAGALGGAW